MQQFSDKNLQQLTLSDVISLKNSFNSHFIFKVTVFFLSKRTPLASPKG